MNCQAGHERRVEPPRELVQALQVEIGLALVPQSGPGHAAVEPHVQDVVALGDGGRVH